MDRIYPLSPTIPLGTPEAVPVSQNITLENALLVSIELLIPPGHCGFTGLRIRSSRQQIIPWGSTDWIIADNYRATFPVNEEIGSRSISIQAYNTDVYPHTFYLRFLIRDLASADNDVSTSPPGGIIGLVGGGDLGDVLVPGLLPPMPLPPSLPPGMVPPSPPE